MKNLIIFVLCIIISFGMVGCSSQSSEKISNIGRSKGIAILLESYIERGNLEGARETAKLLGRELTPAELKNIVEFYLYSKYFPVLSLDEVREIAITFPEGADKAQCLEKILEACFKGGHLDTAKEIVKLLPKGANKVHYLKKILEKQLDIGYGLDARETANLLGETMEKIK